MSQYFENDLNLVSDIKQIKYTYKNKDIYYYVDCGVFSKERVDFGSNVLINALPDLSNYSNILDVGCGYGTIGLAVAKAYPLLSIDMIDVNERAISLTKMNIDYNKVKNTNVFLSNLYLNVNKKYDCIISNPPIRAGKQIVHGVITEGYNYLNNNGFIIVVIQKKQGAPSMEKKMLEVFGIVKILEKKNGYIVY